MVYFAKYQDEEPDFNCGVSTIFDANRPMCYNATVVKGFGMLLILFTSRIYIFQYYIGY